MDALGLEQFLVFVTTVDEGSFSGAARRLNRAQSVITYTIQKLEEQIGAALFDRSGYRPKLTATGRGLLPRARRILEDVAQFRAEAQGMARGLEAEVRLGLADLLPIAWFTPALAAFYAAFPTVSLRITTGSFSLLQALTEGALDIAVSVDTILPDTLIRDRVATVDFVAVASPAHPLARLPGPIATEALRGELQIVLTDQAIATVGRDYGVAAIDRWRVTDLTIKRGLLLAGLGWGSMPEPIVAADLAAGRLVVLPVERWDGSDRLPRFDVVVIRRRDHPLGQAGTGLFERLSRRAGGEGRSLVE